MAVFGVPCFCLITGASRGIGRGIALQLADKVGDNSLLVLTARSEAGLQETKRLVAARRGSGIEVRTVTGDMGNMDTLSTTLSGFFSDIPQSGTFSHAMLFHNAGSLGDITKKARYFDDPDELQEYFGFNLTSVITLTSKFMEMFPKNSVPRRTVVNISSAYACKPLPYLSAFASAKAARDMLFGVVALEETDVHVLNYGPGPVDTDMYSEWTENIGDPDTRKEYADMKEKRSFLTVESTCKVLAKLLEEDNYKSGSHVEYYDICK